MGAITKAVLLAAGRGTRMRELTSDIPKPMLVVRGRPILQHIIDGMRDAGVREVLIVVGWRADVVRDFFGDGAKSACASTTRRRWCRTAPGRSSSWRAIFAEQIRSC
jgi:NDP-sugar pyrophosphorylase family protein